MKNEKKQELRSSGVLAMLGLVSFSLAIIATPWNRQSRDTRSEAALQKAEVVGYQVVQIYREASRQIVSSGKAGSRVPASAVEGESENLRNTGTMGVDPWGQPYRYRILAGGHRENAVRILVWSSGPNKQVESKALDDEEKALDIQPQYLGDDLGVLLSVSQN